MKEVDLTNRESCQHRPDVGQLPPVSIGVERHCPCMGSMARRGLTYSSQFADMDCVHILHERACLGQEVPPVLRHVTGLHLCEDFGGEALEVSIPLQCHMSNNGGLLGETLRILRFSLVSST